MSDNIYFKDAESHFIMVNKAFCNWFGMAADQIVGKSDFDLFAEAHAQQAYNDEQRIIRTGEPLIGVEEKEVWPDGRVTWVSTTKMPLRNETGQIIGTFGVSRDITEHKEAELRAAYYAEKVRRIQQAMEDDVRMAGELQKTFFPHAYPVFPSDAPPGAGCVGFHHHYHPSGMVSGDFCAIRRLSPTESGIFLCDVMGHGVRAALVTALICAMVEDLSMEEKDPGRFLTRMNALLLPILRQEDMFLYATACYMVLDAATGHIRSANAGHPLPMHFQCEGSRVEWLADCAGVRGPALAIDPDPLYPTTEKTIQPGDSVVMFTDGLYEVAGADGEELGEERLLQHARQHAGLPLADLFPALIDDTRRYSATGTLDDDVCLVGFTFRAPIWK
ncbi:MAG: SpoIIE family protein phosphatase [Kiritimatiellales bacterium]|nr:SpoIIE family protein phosphatase [Kiritimatiellales bacterium]